MLKSNILLHDPVYNIDNYEDGKFTTLFYVPHSIEICRIDNKIPPELKAQTHYPTGIAEQINEIDPEKPIREMMMLKPTMVKKWTEFSNVSDYVKNGIVVTNFKEAYTYGGSTFNMLVYMTLIHNIFELEYSMCKLNSSGSDILNLETHVLSGQEFWIDEKTLKEEEFGVHEQSDEEEIKEQTKPETISSKIIKKIVQERREKKHLAEDLQIVKENLLSISKFIKNQEDKTMEKIINVLINHHHLFYYITLHGMEKAQDIYCDKGNKNEFRLFIDYLNHFTDKHEGIVTRDNGFHVNHALIGPNG